jgi:hypothetical protein
MRWRGTFVPLRSRVKAGLHEDLYSAGWPAHIKSDEMRRKAVGLSPGQPGKLSALDHYSVVVCLSQRNGVDDPLPC